MRSVADDLRDQDLKNTSALPVHERLALAFALGQRDLELFMAARGLSRSEAFRLLRLQRQTGRRKSACMTDSLS